MKKSIKGFTVIELIFIILLISTASVVFFLQKNSLEVIAIDSTKKTAVNAMYYSLEEVFYQTNKYYPRTISSDILKSVDPLLFTDPDGIKIGSAGSSYTYLPTNCLEEKCKSYTLKASLQNESDFIKTSRNN